MSNTIELTRADFQWMKALRKGTPIYAAIDEQFSSSGKDGVTDAEDDYCQFNLYILGPNSMLEILRFEASLWYDANTFGADYAAKRSNPKHAERLGDEPSEYAIVLLVADLGKFMFDDEEYFKLYIL